MTDHETTEPALQWVQSSADALRLVLNRDVYPDAVIFRTCYLFTDRCYLFLRSEDDRTLVIEFRRKKQFANLHSVIGEFGNELISQRIRADLDRETRAIRELIVAQAFAEADLDGAQ